MKRETGCVAKVLGIGRPSAHCSRVLGVVSGLVSEAGRSRRVVRRPRSMKREKLVWWLVLLRRLWGEGMGIYIRRE